MDRQIKVDSVLYRMENNIFFWKSSGSNKCLVLRVVVMDHQDLTTGIATGIIWPKPKFKICITLLDPPVGSHSLIVVFPWWYSHSVHHFMSSFLVPWSSSAYFPAMICLMPIVYTYCLFIDKLCQVWLQFCNVVMSKLISELIVQTSC